MESSGRKTSMSKPSKLKSLEHQIQELYSEASLPVKFKAIKPKPPGCNINSSESNRNTNTDNLTAMTNALSSCGNVGSSTSLMPDEHQSCFHESQFVALLINNPVILNEMMEPKMVLARHAAKCKIQNILKQKYRQILSLKELWKRVETLKTRVQFKLSCKRKLTHWEDEFWKCLCRVNQTSYHRKVDMPVYPSNLIISNGLPKCTTVRSVIDLQPNCANPEASGASSSDHSAAKNEIPQPNFVAILKNYPILFVDKPTSFSIQYEAVREIKNILISENYKVLSESDILSRVQTLKSKVKGRKHFQKTLNYWEEEFWKCYCSANNLPENTKVIIKIKPPSSSGIPNNESSKVIEQSDKGKVGSKAYADPNQSNVKSSNTNTLSMGSNTELDKTREFNWDHFVAILKNHLVIFYDGDKPELVLSRHMAIVEIQERLVSELFVFMGVNEIWKRFQTLKSAVKLRKKQKRKMLSWEYEFWKLYSQVGDESTGASSSTQYVALVNKCLRDTFDVDMHTARNAECDVIKIEDDDKSNVKNEPICISDDENSYGIVEPFEFVAVDGDETTMTIKSETTLSEYDLTEEIDNDIPKSTKLDMSEDKIPESEETKNLSLPELKRLVLLENLKYLRSAQELVDLKIKRELHKNDAGGNALLGKGELRRF